MSKVRSTMTLTRVKDGWSLKVPDPNNLKAQCVDKFIRSDEVQSIILELEVRAPFKEKTLSQLGYLHSAVWPQFYQLYRYQGMQVETREQMEKVRNDVKAAIGFTKSEVVRLKHAFDEAPRYKDYTVPKSFADASKAETSEAIDAIVRLAAEYGILVPGPEEYLEKHGKTEFES